MRVIVDSFFDGRDFAREGAYFFVTFQARQEAGGISNRVCGCPRKKSCSKKNNLEMAEPPTTEKSHDLDDNPCANGCSERQSKGLYLPDMLKTQREQEFDRMGYSVIGTVACKADVTMTNPVCRMGTTGFSLKMQATHDRNTNR